jgi:transcriptional regulator with XRE-family HTH domain
VLPAHDFATDAAPARILVPVVHGDPPIEADPSRWTLLRLEIVLVVQVGKSQMSGLGFHPTMPHPGLVGRRVGDLRRRLGTDIRGQRIDAGLSTAALAREAGLDPSYVWRIERGDVQPSLTSLAAIGDALGSDLVVRLYPNTGPRIRDRHQAAIIEALLRIAHPRWTPTDEVKVRKPASGWIDVAFHDRAENLLIATEVESLLQRLEQLIRWHQEKVDALPSSELWRFAAANGAPTVSRLLVIRSTTSNREIVRQHERLLGAAYPARASDAWGALTGTSRWPGHAILWADVRQGTARILDGPPRRITVGR